MRSILRLLLVAAFGGMPCGSGGAQEPLPQNVKAKLDEISAILEAMRHDGQDLLAAAKALRTMIEADESLAAPVNDRFRAMLREQQPGSVPQLHALLLPFLLMNAVPNGARAEVFARDSFRLATADGERNDTVFLVAPDTDPAPVHHYRLTWREMPQRPDLSMTIALTEGIHFGLLANDCPARLPPSGSCNLTVQFRIAGNGIRQDQLIATYGPLRAQAPLNGQGAGFPPANLEILPPASTTVRMDSAAAEHGESEVVFRVANRGPGALPPFVPRLWSRESLKPEFWQLDQSSTCPTATTMSGESCTIVLAFNPTRNGQEDALFGLPDPAGRADPRKHGEVFGYARGFLEELPIGTLTNGDACPAPGTPAEVATRRGIVGPGNADVVSFDTLSCGSWEAERRGIQSCSDPGIGEGGARRSWKRSSATTPWRLISVRPAEVQLTCRNGVIERIGTR
jgi:hypothetical protein